jgi:hypothetical protein
LDDTVIVAWPTPFESEPVALVTVRTVNVALMFAVPCSLTIALEAFTTQPVYHVCAPFVVTRTGTDAARTHSAVDTSQKTARVTQCQPTAMRQPAG